MASDAIGRPREPDAPPPSRVWEVGEEADALELATGIWRAAKVLAKDEEKDVYTVEFDAMEDPWAQAQTPPHALVTKGSKVERWRLCKGGEDLEIKVDGLWSYGKVFMVYEQRWFVAVITDVDHEGRTLSVQYKGWPPPAPETVARMGVDLTRERGLSFDSERICRLLPPTFAVGEELEVCMDRRADDRRWVHWKYAGPRSAGVMGREGDPLENTLGVDVLGDGALSGCTLPGSRKYVFVRADSPDLSRGGVHISPFLPPTVRRRVG